MSFWEANKTGERKNCYTVTASGPGTDDLRKMLEKAKVYDIEDDDEEEKQMFGLQIDNMSPEQAKQWFCAYQLANRHCPTEIIRKIDGIPPKQPVSFTVFVSPQPICDKKKDCVKYAQERDERLNLATNQGKGALSGKKDHAEDRKLLAGCRFRMGDIGTKTADFEGMYREMKKKHDELLAMLKEYLAALVKQTGAPWVVTVHKGNAMCRLVKAPHHSHCRLLKPGEFDPPEAGERPLRQLGPGVARGPTYHQNDSDRHRSERHCGREGNTRAAQTDSARSHRGEPPPPPRVTGSTTARPNPQEQNGTPHRPTQPGQQTNTRPREGGTGNSHSHSQTQQRSTQSSREGPRGRGVSNPTKIHFDLSLDSDDPSADSHAATDQTSTDQAAADQAAAARRAEAAAVLVFENPATDVRSAVSNEDSELVRQQMSDEANAGDVVGRCGGFTLYRSSLQTLQGTTWLNDDVINYYVRLLAIRDAHACRNDRDRTPCFFFSTHFYAKLMNHGHPLHDDQFEYANVKTWSKNAPGKSYIIV